MRTPAQATVIKTKRSPTHGEEENFTNKGKTGLSEHRGCQRHHYLRPII